jgi:hypothetical protein
MEGLVSEERELLSLGNEVSIDGTLTSFDGEMVVAFETFTGIALSIPEEAVPVPQETVAEKWWLKPQTYHNGEGPDMGAITRMNITVLHDWNVGGLNWGEQDAPDEYWSYAAVKERWDRAHELGMRVEAVISIQDIFFVDVGPEEAFYPFSGIDLNGDHIQYEDPPAFIGCTNQHGWQDYLEARMRLAVDLGADGIIVDDYEGTSRWLTGTPTGMAGSYAGPGGCFCSECEAGFREYLRSKYPAEELSALDIPDLDQFDYSDYLLERGWTMERLGEESMKFAGWEHPRAEIVAPLYEDYAAFQYQQNREFTQELKDTILRYAREEYGREISWSINSPEVSYIPHMFYAFYDRNVGGIPYYGYPPKGTEGYLYRLGFDIFGLPRIRETPMDPVIVAVINAYDTANLLAIKDAEAYANRGAWIEMGYYLEEKKTTEEEEEAAFQPDPVLKNAFNTFYLDHSELFDYESTTSMAQAAVVYASASINYALYNHMLAFNGMSEILTDLHVQFDPIFAGDGLGMEDAISEDRLENYDIVFLPHTVALTEGQVAAILAYVEAGGTVVALGDVGLLDEYGVRVARPDLEQIVGQRQTELGEGTFYHLRQAAFSAGSIYDDGIYDLASAYFQYYIENNHPAVWPFLELIEEEPTEYMSESTAEGIRAEFAAIVDSALASRVVLDTFSENVGVQVYLKPEAPQKIFVHLINYDYELETDTVHDQESIPVAIELPEGFDVKSVSVISPDFEGTETPEFTVEDGYVQFSVPELHIWDVVVIE